MITENIKLYHGDCLDVMKVLNDKSIDLIVTDPPYNIKKAEWDKWKTKEDYISWCGKWILECQRLLKDNGSFYFFHNDMTQIAMLMEWIRQNTKFVFKQFLIVNKTDNSYIKDLYGTQKHFRNYINIAEYCLFYTFQDGTGLSKILPKCFKSYLDYMTKEKNEMKWNVKMFNDYLGYKSIASHWFWQDCNFTLQNQPRFICYDDYKKLQKTGYFKKEYEDLRKEYEDLRKEYEDLRYIFNENTGEFNIFNFSFKKDIKLEHPTQKPIKLLEKLLRCSSNNDSIIFDPFMGSGTTGVACINTNRKFIGIEKDDKYFEIAKKRIEEAENKLF